MFNLRTDSVPKRRARTDQHTVTPSSKAGKAVMPSLGVISNTFADHFILFKAKNQVSNDFYFFEEYHNVMIFALADCRGNNGPGAFMPMIASTTLKQIVKQSGVTSPGQALKMLDEKLLLAQYESNSKASSHVGIKIALCALHLNSGLLQFAGAGHSVLVSKKNRMELLTAGNFRIADNSKQQRNFANHELMLKKGDRLFLYSNGFAMQIGGPNGAPFGDENLVGLIKSIAGKPMLEQQTVVSRILDHWQGELPQSDDISFIGLEV